MKQLFPLRPRSTDALITCFYTEARYKTHSFSQLPVFPFIHRCAPSLVALHLIPIRESRLLSGTQTVTQGSRALFTLWSFLSGDLTEPGLRPRLRNCLVFLSAKCCRATLAAEDICIVVASDLCSLLLRRGRQKGKKSSKANKTRNSS